MRSSPRSSIAALENLGLDELNGALGAAEAREAQKQTDEEVAEADYDTAYAEARTAFVSSNADRVT